MSMILNHPPRGLGPPGPRSLGYAPPHFRFRGLAPLNSAAACWEPWAMELIAKSLKIIAHE